MAYLYFTCLRRFPIAILVYQRVHTLTIFDFYLSKSENDPQWCFRTYVAKPQTNCFVCVRFFRKKSHHITQVWGRTPHILEGSALSFGAIPPSSMSPCCKIVQIYFNIFRIDFRYISDMSILSRIITIIPPFSTLFFGDRLKPPPGVLCHTSSRAAARQSSCTTMASGNPTASYAIRNSRGSYDWGLEIPSKIVILEFIVGVVTLIFTFLI